ncbi:FliL-like flagellar basal body-associated protein [Octadecabacter antarcticus 307]|uniref:Flagellar protein FliL n=1 Tax=Octadecabacter antarcticus 307 TaxID=391626 RepID=M9RFD2_9RHOB|nr:flagellar basal body-associated FliL family protein [Octadecabacter antarcticus]AGI68505.1 FliL-like flagellar basal body-associated protein [Octadecabacter antarcticus 307]
MSEEEEPKKKSGLGTILTFGVIGLVMMGVGIGAGYFLFGGQSNSPEQLAAAIIERNDGALTAEVEEDASDETEGEIPERQSKDSARDDVFQTLYYEIPGTMTTNLKDSRRFLQIGVGISTQYDEVILQNVEANLLAIKAAILATLSDYGEADVVGREARNALSEDLKATINAELEALEGFGGVEGVLLTSFVMQ